MIISNFKDLADNSLRRKALLIAEAGYGAIEIEKVISKRIKMENGVLKIRHIDFLEGGKNEIEMNLDNFERVFVVGIGKGAALSCQSLEKILGKRLFGGIALDIKKPPFGIKRLFSKIKFFKGSHPLPSRMNIKATRKIIGLAESLTEKDLLLAFICGGGSALACASGEELKNSTLVVRELTGAGAKIDELNTVRKHLSEFKGGGLAKAAYPATVISLIVSDVCGNNLSNVASGPTVFDKTAKKESENILRKYELNPEKFNLYETPKDEKFFENVKNILFVCNQDAVTAMVEKAGELGFSPKINSLAIEGEAREILLPLIEAAKPGEAIVAAGETTVLLTDNRQPITDNKKIGKGGRNQEAVLGAMAKIKDSSSNFDGAVVISFASDTRDNTEAAGAIGDCLTIEKAEKLKLNPREFLDSHNSFNFFKKTDDLIYAERKCFNVADLMIVMKRAVNKI